MNVVEAMRRESEKIDDLSVRKKAKNRFQKPRNLHKDTYESDEKCFR